MRGRFNIKKNFRKIHRIGGACREAFVGLALGSLGRGLLACCIDTHGLLGFSSWFTNFSKLKHELGSLAKDNDSSLLNKWQDALILSNF